MAVEACCLRLLVVLIVFLNVESKFMAYNTTSQIVPGKLNVHLVPHTHDDVGWRKTVDQYYTGANNSLLDAPACVRNVLDSLVPALLADKNRKFIYAEQKWGMCMQDEAATHYIDMIDQTTLGHRFIKQEFNVTPRVGWQIDSFGHSSVQAYLLAAEVGFDSLFFGRIDYQDIATRKNEKSLEVVWRGSKSLGSSAQIFAGAFPTLYVPPSHNFYFDTDDVPPLVQDNMNLGDYNVADRINDFVSEAISQANITRTNHIMWTMGKDFAYQYANSWFSQMDKFIHHVNQDGRVNALYSTPSIYTDAKHATNESWPIKSDDFFPYASEVNAYWTGYFTSRPALKRYVRMMSSYYLAARQLEFFTGISKSGPNTDSLADALAIAQHHDAVSGTSRQHVADDYTKRLSIGYKEAEKVVAESLSCLISSRLSTGCKSCPLLNISYCPPSEVDLSKGKHLVIVVYNPLGWKREDVIKIPVVSEKVTVKDSTGKEIESQILPLLNASVSIRNDHVKAYLGIAPSVTTSYWLAFSATVPPLGFSTYMVSSAATQTGHLKIAATTSERHTVYKTETSQNETIKVGPGNLKLIYSGNDGKLIQYTNSRSSVKESVTQSFSYYPGDDGSVVDYGEDGNPHFQASGAYVFRPNGTYPIKSEGQVTRVYREKEHAEIEFTIGPIPVDDRIGKEIVTKITTSMRTNKQFYTDSNGRDFIQRIRDYRKDWDLEVNQPVAGNYYPLSVLVDRSVGGSSIVDGQLELMLHRFILITGKYHLRIDPLGEGAKWRRSFGQEIYSPLLLAFTEQNGDDWTNSHVTTFSGMDPSYTLPDNVAIITLQELEDGKVLFRLAHLYEIGEDKHLSVMASVELKKVFANKKIKHITEMSLSANQERREMERKRLVWNVQGSSEEGPKGLRGGPVDPTKLVVNLAPMEIRTFTIDF
ncbi:putative alpha-mannosidase [Rosa chinensis]|uniref:Alpha-mannosidase n=1 Tax=Rosa chinensis TaxID=74649 RepID=A0A2P6P4K4_ROSCH|nr:putative alpha-mannosidase [Rosa chinensis]